MFDAVTAARQPRSALNWLRKGAGAGLLADVAAGRLAISAAAAARPRTPTAHARNHIHAAASLLAWLRGRGTELTACGQAAIDQWLRTGPSASLARDFLAWAASRGYCQRLSIPAPPHATGPAISQDQRWTLTARLLHDTTLDPTDRVAGCLLLLYGQPLSRTAAKWMHQAGGDWTRYAAELARRPHQP